MSRPANQRTRLSLFLNRQEKVSNVRWMSLVCFAAGSLTLYAAVFPINPERKTIAMLVAAAIILLAGCLYWIFAARFRVWMLIVAAILGFSTGLLSLARSPDGASVVLNISTLLWTCVLVGAIYNPPIARAFAAFIGIGLGPALVLSGIDRPLTLWVALAGSFAVTIEILSRSSSRLRVEANTDPLTGLLNRKGFDEVSRDTLARVQRTGEKLTIAHIDIDDFKRINDTEGHFEGDRVLKACIEAWRTRIRSGDILARPGGDEFILLLPGSDRDDAILLLKRLHQASPVEFSYGVAEFDLDDTVKSALARADIELYAAKSRLSRRGRLLLEP